MNNNFLRQPNINIIQHLQELGSFDIFIYDIKRAQGINIMQLLPENISIKYSPKYSEQDIYGRFRPIRFLTSGDSITYTFNLKLNEDYIIDNVIRVGTSNKRFNTLQEFTDNLKQMEFPVKIGERPEMYIKIANQIEATGYMNVNVEKSLPTINNSSYSIVNIGITFTVLYDETNYSVKVVDDSTLYQTSELTREQEKIFEQKNISIDDFYYSVINTDYNYLLTANTKFKALQDYYKSLYNINKVKKAIQTKDISFFNKQPLPSIDLTKEELVTMRWDYYQPLDSLKSLQNEHSGFAACELATVNAKVLQYGALINEALDYFVAAFRESDIVNCLLTNEMSKILEIYKNLNLLSLDYLSKADMLSSINKTKGIIEKLLLNQMVSVFSQLKTSEEVKEEIQRINTLQSTNYIYTLDIPANWYEDFRFNLKSISQIENMENYRITTDLFNWADMFATFEEMLYSDINYNTNYVKEYPIPLGKQQILLINDILFNGEQAMSFILQSNYEEIPSEVAFVVFENAVFEMRKVIIKLFEKDILIARSIRSLSFDLLAILNQKLDYLEGRVI